MSVGIFCKQSRSSSVLTGRTEHTGGYKEAHNNPTLGLDRAALRSMRTEAVLEGIFAFPGRSTPMSNEVTVFVSRLQLRSLLGEGSLLHTVSK